MFMMFMIIEYDSVCCTSMMFTIEHRKCDMMLLLTNMSMLSFMGAKLFPSFAPRSRSYGKNCSLSRRRVVHCH